MAERYTFWRFAFFFYGDFLAFQIFKDANEVGFNGYSSNDAAAGLRGTSPPRPLEGGLRLLPSANRRVKQRRPGICIPGLLPSSTRRVKQRRPGICIPGLLPSSTRRVKQRRPGICIPGLLPSSKRRLVCPHCSAELIPRRGSLI